MTLSRPLPEEVERDNDERDGEADPDAEDAAPAVKAEHVAERQAEEPIAGKVDEHGMARFTYAPQRAGGDRLDAIEDLEGSGKHEQVCPYRHDDLILRVNVQERTRQQEKDTRC